MSTNMLDLFNSFGKPPVAMSDEDMDVQTRISGGLPGGGHDKYIRFLVRILAGIVDNLRPVKEFAREKPPLDQKEALQSYNASLLQHANKQRDYISARGCMDGSYYVWKNKIGREFMVTDLLDMIGHGNRSERLIEAFNAYPEISAKILFDIADGRTPSQSLQQTIQSESLKSRFHSGHLGATSAATHHPVATAEVDDEDVDAYMDDPSQWAQGMSA